MTPVIRVDNDVMEELKRHAVRLGLVFESPNATLRSVLGLDRINKADDKISSNPEPPILKHGYESGHEIGTGDLKSLEIVLNRVHSAYGWALIPIPMDQRGFFPGYKVKFELVTNVGAIMTHVTSAPKGTPYGDPMGGKYIQTGLRKWFDNHATLREGSKLRFDILERGKRYRLSEVES